MTNSGDSHFSELFVAQSETQETADENPPPTGLSRGRFIIENTTHAITRRPSTISHEMAHVILEHEFGLTILTDDKCRAGDPRAEAEADWLGGELLIPTDAAKIAALPARRTPRWHCTSASASAGRRCG